jgi:hypothetical protein
VLGGCRKGSFGLFQFLNNFIYFINNSILFLVDFSRKLTKTFVFRHETLKFCYGKLMFCNNSLRFNNGSLRFNNDSLIFRNKSLRFTNGKLRVSVGKLRVCIEKLRVSVKKLGFSVGKIGVRCRKLGFNVKNIVINSSKYNDSPMWESGWCVDTVGELYAGGRAMRFLMHKYVSCLSYIFISKLCNVTVVGGIGVCSYPSSLRSEDPPPKAQKNVSATNGMYIYGTPVLTLLSMLYSGYQPINPFLTI